MLEKKINAAKKALSYIEENSTIGLGSGSTAKEFIKLLAQKVKSGFKIDCCLASSFDTRDFAISVGLGKLLVDSDQVNRIDFYIDGADFVAENFVLKGKGLALTREKILAYNAKNFFIIVDDSKLGKRDFYLVPLEVMSFASSFVIKYFESKNIAASVKKGSDKLGPIITDNGNFIIEANLKIENPYQLEKELKIIPGVLESGIFTKFSKIIIGYEKETKVYNF